LTPVGAAILIAAWGAQGAAPLATLAPEKVRAAIEWGRAAGEDEIKQYQLKTTDTWSADFDTPFLRVAQLSAAMTRRGKVLTESEVPDKFVSDELHVYLHARQADATPTPLPNFEYVMLVRPAGEGRIETVLPTSVDRFVRQVPIPGYYGPARVARSVRASFPPSALVAGGELRVVLQGGRVETIPIEAALLARIR
jgi:hypothetical protein